MYGHRCIECLRVNLMGQTFGKQNYRKCDACMRCEMYRMWVCRVEEVNLGVPRSYAFRIIPVHMYTPRPSTQSAPRIIHILRLQLSGSVRCELIIVDQRTSKDDKIVL